MGFFTNHVSWSIEVDIVFNSVVSDRKFKGSMFTCQFNECINVASP